MKRLTVLLTAALLACSLSAGPASAGGVTVERYVQDTEHKNEVIAFYLNALLSGITLANERAKPPLFCMDNSTNKESAFSLLDKRINRLKKENKISADTPLDGLIMDMMIDEFPCK